MSTCRLTRADVLRRARLLEAIDALPSAEEIVTVVVTYGPNELVINADPLRGAIAEALELERLDLERRALDVQIDVDGVMAVS